jgi:hypothetical protein
MAMVLSKNTNYSPSELYTIPSSFALCGPVEIMQQQLFTILNKQSQIIFHNTLIRAEAI